MQFVGLVDLRAWVFRVITVGLGLGGLFVRDCACGWRAVVFWALGSKWWVWVLATVLLCGFLGLCAVVLLALRWAVAGSGLLWLFVLGLWFVGLLVVWVAFGVCLCDTLVWGLICWFNVFGMRFGFGWFGVFGFLVSLGHLVGFVVCC